MEYIGATNTRFDFEHFFYQLCVVEYGRSTPDYRRAFEHAWSAKQVFDKQIEYLAKERGKERGERSENPTTHF